MLLDAALWAALSLPVLIGMLSPRPGDIRWWAQGLGLGAMAAAIATGRRRPLLLLSTVVTLTLVHANFVFAMPVAAYLTGRRLDRARPVLWVFTTIFVGGTVLNIARGIDVTTWFSLTIYLVLLGVLPWLAGRYWRQYHELLHAGWERAEHLEREQRIIAERERLRERARIAQDMHDSLGHELALLAVRAGALQVAPGLTQEHRAQAAQLREGAAEATEHLRQIIGVLRESGTGTDGSGPALGLEAAASPGPPETAPTRPARESIAELVERAHASGIPVHLVTEDGGQADPLPDTGAMGAPAAHRVVQEALTNAAKHAPGAPVTVRLGHDTGTLTVSVINQAPSAQPPPPPPTASTGGGGLGLAGLAERVRLAGGTLRTGPTPDGGFEVIARLPTTGPHATPPPAQDARTGPDPAPDPVHRDQDTHEGGDTENRETAPSESARHLARQRRQVRRKLVTAIAVPAVLVAALSGIMLGYYVYATLNSVLPPAQFAALRIGTPLEEAEATLPRMQTLHADTHRPHYPEPAGAHCRYYRTDAGMLGLGDLYRLCFTAGRLTSKEVLPVPSQPAEPAPPATPGGAR